MSDQRKEMDEETAKGTAKETAEKAAKETPVSARRTPKPESRGSAPDSDSASTRSNISHVGHNRLVVASAATGTPVPIYARQAILLTATSNRGNPVMGASTGRTRSSAPSFRSWCGPTEVQGFEQGSLAG